jgi:argininosuccinate lyase
MLRLPDAFCTGSSIMPQKINPDVLELIRGKTGRVVGNLQTLLTVVKGLPMAYNRDLQEDKEAIFDSFDTIENCLALAAIIVEQAELRRPAIAARLDQGYLDATSLMEYLILRGVPQRTAHHDCGELVRMAMNRNVRLLDLTLEEFHKVNPAIGEDVYRYLGAERVVASYRSYGSSAPEQVEQQVAAWKERLALVDKTG